MKCDLISCLAFVCNNNLMLYISVLFNTVSNTENKFLEESSADLLLNTADLDDGSYHGPSYSIVLS